MLSKKRILIHDYAGHPFQVQLSRELAGRGFQVLHLYAGYNVTPHGALHKTEQDPASFDVRPIYIREPLEKYSLVKRYFQEREYGRLLAKEIAAFQPGIVISANTPLDAQWSALQSSHNIQAYFISWLQDVIGIATHKILSKKIPGVGALVGQYFIQLERAIARRSDFIIPITQDFVPLLTQWGISPQKIRTIPNWAPLDEIQLQPKANSWSVKNKLADKFVFLYSGTLGMKHNPDLLLQLGKSLNRDQNAVLVIVSQGPGADWLKVKMEENNLRNILIMDYQPMEVFSKVLGAGDVLMAILEPYAGVYSVPSKVLSYLCARRPLLLSVPPDNLAARIVNMNKAGVVIAPNDNLNFVKGAQNLMKDASLREFYAHNARQYAETNFDIDRITTQFESMLA
jgi:colanic acid biosynthesis glycosyl transferase WcaI